MHRLTEQRLPVPIEPAALVEIRDVVVAETSDAIPVELVLVYRLRLPDTSRHERCIEQLRGLVYRQVASHCGEEMFRNAAHGIPAVLVERSPQLLAEHEAQLEEVDLVGFSMGEERYRQLLSGAQLRASELSAAPDEQATLREREAIARAAETVKTELHQDLLERLYAEVPYITP